MMILEHKCGGRWKNEKAYTWETRSNKIPKQCPRCRAFLTKANIKHIGGMIK